MSATFLAQTMPESMFDVLALPLLVWFVGLFIYFMGWNQERQGKEAGWKWAALIPLGIGVILGYMEFAKTLDSTGFYQAYYKGQRRIFYSHHLAFFLPLVTVVGLFAWNFVTRRRKPIEAA